MQPAECVNARGEQTAVLLDGGGGMCGVLPRRNEEDQKPNQTDEDERRKRRRGGTRAHNTKEIRTTDAKCVPRVVLAVGHLLPKLPRCSKSD